MRKFSVGADPEIFLADAAGALVAACGRIGGTKDAPLPLDIGQGFAVQEDNVALEYNIPAARSKEQLQQHIGRAMSCLSDMVARQGLKFSQLSSASFPETQLMHPLAQVFGCDPDYNAWKNGERNPKPSADDKTLRTCGGHVHVGYAFESPKDVPEFIKYMDLFLGVPSVLMDNDEKRRLLYGAPGAFRWKPYGCEYRSLSNFWVFNPETVEWVWDATEMALDSWQNKTIEIELFSGEIQHAINSNDRKLATALQQQFNLKVAHA